MKTLTVIAAGLCAATVMGAVHGQDYTEPPAFGSVTLQAGFSPDPHVRQLTAGGSIRAETRFSECRGSIANAPDYSLYYTAGSLPLIFTVDADQDTTLVVNGPDARWYCDDDGAQSPLNPMVRFNNPQSGRYDIWVGTYSSGAGVPATLFISELGEHTRQSAGLGGYQPPAVTASLNIGLAARYGDVTLNGGFLPDPYQISVMAGGTISTSGAINNANGYCTGYVTREPTLELRYNGGSDLHIYTAGSPDTVLAINAPDGSWHCNDDADGLNAGLSFPNGQAGVYDIYVGAFARGSQQTTLRISEIALGYGPGGK